MPEHQDIEALAREAGVECIEALRDEVRNSKGANRIAAIKALLAQGCKAHCKGHGKGAPPKTGDTAGTSPAVMQAIEALRAAESEEPSVQDTTINRKNHEQARK